jgi:hypothetical protein
MYARPTFSGLYDETWLEKVKVLTYHQEKLFRKFHKKFVGGNVTTNEVAKFISRMGSITFSINCLTERRKISTDDLSLVTKWINELIDLVGGDVYFN